MLSTIAQIAWWVITCFLPALVRLALLAVLMRKKTDNFA